ncbi:MAG: U32 family peptidase [Thermodesulfobacteriota bacterium]|nr:U32 family peptidase [Thermodesulfobacteriota bacterium]
MKKPELLAPAGNLEKLEVAVHYGADAVYLSGKSYGLRSFAGNFTLPEMEEGIQIAHGQGVKVYVAVNTFPRNNELKTLSEYLIELKRLEADAIIVSDPGVIAMAKEWVPGLPLHLSTQMNTTNWRSVQFWKDQEIYRVNLARELSFSEIEHIRKKVDIETEVFVHGAMCVSYSGRCILSNYLTRRDSNRGECSQPCRWRYTLMEESRPGIHLPVFEDEQGTSILSSKDLCLIEHIPTLVDIGIDAFKIEGRMKGIHYVGNVVRVYRQAINRYLSDPGTYEFRTEWLEELKKVSYRDYTTGFFLEESSCGMQNYSSHSYIQTHDLVGIIKEISQDRKVKVEIRNQVKLGDELEFIGKSGDVHCMLLQEMKDEEDKDLTIAQPNQFVILQVDFPTQRNDLIRRQK